MPDRIEKSIDIDAPIERVWRALTDHKEFGAWFRVSLDQPFEAGGRSTGRMTYPGFEDLPWEARIEAMQEPNYFAYRWPPYYHGLEEDTSGDPWTLVEFRLEPLSSGTRLTVIESGFDALPESRRGIAFRSNEGGWEEQVRNIKAHVGG